MFRLHCEDGNAHGHLGRESSGANHQTLPRVRGGCVVCEAAEREFCLVYMLASMVDELGSKFHAAGCDFSHVRWLLRRARRQAGRQ